MSLIVDKILLEASFADGVFYHGSKRKFDRFGMSSDNKTYREFDLPSWHFTKDIDYARSYGPYLYTVRLNINRTFDTTNRAHMEMLISQLEEFGVDVDTVLDEQFHSGLPYWTCGDAYYAAKANGFDSILIQEELEREVLSIAVFDPSDIQIMNVKSPNAVLAEGVDRSKITPEIIKELSAFSSADEWLRAGGISDEALDRAAFGFTETDIKQLHPKQLNIKWKLDLSNVVEEQRRSGLNRVQWARTINLEEPIDVCYEKDRFWIEDGHHRYYAAKILGKELNVNLEIKQNPIPKLGGKLAYDDLHKELFKLYKPVI